MKKLISLIAVILLLLTMSVTMIAGSIPEDLLNNDNAKLYIGRVDGVTTLAEGTQPYEENKVIYIDITPTHKYKGDVEIGVSERHIKPDFGTFIPEKDKEYLFGYFDENNFYIYEIKSRNEKTIKLVDSNKYDMTKRLEDYLNEGAFAMAEQERLTLGKQISFAEFLYKKPSLSSSVVEKVIFCYQNESHEVDIDKFFQIAKDIMITNVKNEELHDIVAKPKQPDPYKTNLYIELLGANDQLVYFGAVSRFGEVDRYSLSMGRLMEKDYEMKTEDLSKLYSLLPTDVQKEIKLPEELPADKPLELSVVPKKNYIGWIVCAVAVFFVLVLAIVYKVIRKRKMK